MFSLSTSNCFYISCFRKHSSNWKRSPIARLSNPFIKLYNPLWGFLIHSEAPKRERRWYVVYLTGRLFHLLVLESIYRSISTSIEKKTEIGQFLRDSKCNISLLTSQRRQYYTTARYFESLGTTLNNRTVSDLVNI